MLPDKGAVEKMMGGSEKGSRERQNAPFFASQDFRTKKCM